MLIPLSTIFNKKHAKKQTGETKNVRREENGAFFFVVSFSFSIDKVVVNVTHG